MLRIPIPLPSREEQDKIAITLGASSEKIRLLEGECAILDELYQVVLEGLINQDLLMEAPENRRVTQ